MEFSRRGFLRMMLAAAAAEAVDQVVPLGRVWSFPSKPRCMGVDHASGRDYSALTVGQLTYDDILVAYQYSVAQMGIISPNHFWASASAYAAIRNGVPTKLDWVKEIKSPIIYGGQKA